MKSLIVTTEIEIADFEIEDHVANTHRFFKLTHLTLDDLDVYTPRVDLVQAGRNRSMTNQEACTAMLAARAALKAIDDALDIENAA